MKGKYALDKMEVFFMALADSTRLRLLNLMRDDEICVCFFTEVLGESQPKISRHLAYLRSAGIVAARREGKWMHYSITSPQDEGRRRVLDDVLNWLGSHDEMQSDRSRYKDVCCSPEMLVQIARTPIDFISAPVATSRGGVSADEARFEIGQSSPHEARPAHNELEEFLL